MIWFAFILTVFILVALLTGYLSLKRRHSLIFEKREFCVTYYNTFQAVLTSIARGNINHKKFQWLRMQAGKMQTQVGQAGLMIYRNPYQGMIYNDYPVIINEIGKLADRHVDPFTANSIEQILLLEIGKLDNKLEEAEKDQKKVKLWLSIGITQIFTVPLSILEAFNIIGSSTVKRAAGSRVYRVFSGVIVFIVAIIAVFGNVVTIIQGYDQTKKFLINRFSISTDSTRYNSKTDTTKSLKPLKHQWQHQKKKRMKCMKRS